MSTWLTVLLVVVLVGLIIWLSRIPISPFGFDGLDKASRDERKRVVEEYHRRAGVLDETPADEDLEVPGEADRRAG